MIYIQTQCHWTIRTQDPTARIKFTFVDWQMPTSGDGCMAAYFQIQDGTGLDEGTGESGSSAAVKLCGKNPGKYCRKRKMIMKMTFYLIYIKTFRIWLRLQHLPVFSRKNTIYKKDHKCILIQNKVLMFFSFKAKWRSYSNCEFCSIFTIQPQKRNSK